MSEQAEKPYVRAPDQPPFIDAIERPASYLWLVVRGRLEETFLVSHVSRIRYFHPLKGWLRSVFGCRGYNQEVFGEVPGSEGSALDW